MPQMTTRKFAFVRTRPSRLRERLERELREEIRTIHRSYRREVVLYTQSQQPATRR